PEAFSKLLMGHLEALQIIVESLRFLDGVEIGALDVLDQGCFQNLLIVEVNDSDRDLVKAGRLRGAQAALPGHQLKALPDLPDYQRLQDADSPNALRKGGKVILVKRLPRLIRILVYLIDRNTGRLSCN